MKDIYKEKGYNLRSDYLKALSEEYGVDYDTILSLATLLGPSEDFDGLIAALEDITYK